jgi:NAD(P)-dependent dehydrogenase (short-subunit alcohol dehydrogenase family)
MSFTTRDIPDQTGRVAVVTGANSGLGLATTRALAAARAHVVMAVRDLDKAARARDDVLGSVPEASLELVPLDLAELASVDRAAATIRERHDQVDLLVNNAGVMATPETRTPDGFELQLATNHLGHFVLTARLLPALAAGIDSRVVSVTSFARLLGTPVGRRDPHLERLYEPWWAYGRSKLANAHFGIELHRRLVAAGAPVASLVAHPGLSATDLQARGVRTSGTVGHRFWHAVARTAGMPPARGALPQLRAATDPHATSGEVYAPRYVASGPPVRRPVGPWMGAHRPARILWEVSERETGIRFDVAALVGDARTDSRAGGTPQ